MLFYYCITNRIYLIYDALLYAVLKDINNNTLNYI